MNIEQLSKRLETVFEYIPNQSTLADIGSDHAYLPCYAVLKGKVTYAIAGEVAEGPYQSAVNQVVDANLTKQIEVRKGDGLEVISSGEVSCVTIAGMGGTLIAKILEEGKSKLTSTMRLVLQPNIGSVNVRKWLQTNGWAIVNESILREDNHIYEVICADFQTTNALTEQELLMGPFLLKEKNEAFVQKWNEEKKQLHQILQSLDQAKETPEVREKKKKIVRDITLIEEGLK
ncbi:tRNA (adenine(22)-N(1))-methyltransferase TrmK [Bacillus carboniphilus]|uniref:tRNA (Adenine(22)-N(1))-methyltransferase TrmK n=1 Tax=Bacillus carboniphilus TaxID=86663 RepID=A0ABN0WLL1_9BACI